MHFPDEIFHHKPFCLLSGVSLQQDITTDIVPIQSNEPQFQVCSPTGCLHEGVCFAKLFGKWNVEDGLIDTFRDPRGSGPPERRKGASRY